MPEDRRHIAVMFTDIVGYTALMGSAEDKAFDMLKQNHAIHEILIKKHKGKLIKEVGDGTLASFPLASNAVRCAIDIQREAKIQNIPLKIGIHQGEMVLVGADILGDGVNVASRLQESAEEGCISISGAVYRDVKNKAGIEVEYLEDKTFKNVDEPVKVYKVHCDVKEEVREAFYEKTSSKLSYYIIGAVLVLIVAMVLIRILYPQQQSVVEEELDKSIAVLPFKNLSPDEENQYFADGVMEGVLNHLSKVKDLRVASRSSTEKYRENIPSAQKIAEELNVTYLLEASVFRSEDKIRITAQLINAANDEHLWSEQYDRELKDVFEVMSDISQEVASEVKAIVTPEVKEKIETPPTQNIEAYDLQMKGWHYLKMYQTSRNRRYLNNALVLFKQVVELDSNFIGGYSGLASIYVHKGISDSTFKYAEKIIQLDPEDDNGYYMRASYYWQANQPDLAISDYKKAIELVPSTHYVYLNLGQLYITKKKDVRNGIKYIDKAFEVAKEKDPKIDPLMLSFSGLAFLDIGDYDIVEKYLREALDWQVGCGGISDICLMLKYQGKFDQTQQFLDSNVR